MGHLGMRRALAVVVAAPFVLAGVALGVGAKFAHDDALEASSLAECAESFELISRYTTSARTEMYVRDAAVVSVGLGVSELDGRLSAWLGRLSSLTDDQWSALTAELGHIPDELVDGANTTQDYLLAVRAADEAGASGELADLAAAGIGAADALADDAAVGLLAASDTGGSAIVTAHEVSAKLNEEAFLAGRVLAAAGPPGAAERLSALRLGSNDDLDDVRRVIDAEGAELLDLLTTEERTAAWDQVRDLTDEVLAGGPPMNPTEALTILIEATALQTSLTEFAEAITERFVTEARGEGDAAVQTRNLLLAAGGLGLVVTFVLAWLVTRSISGRLRRMARLAERISEGELDNPPLSLSGTDEFAQLGRAMDEMQCTLRVAHRQLGALASGAEHHISPGELPGSIGRSMRVAIRRVGSTTADLRRRATHDSLTGLLDRDGLRAAIAELAGGVAGLGVLVVDLDGFKDVNDLFGHDVGDAVLGTVARRLESVTRSDDDLVARLGGDEFVVVVSDCDGLNQLARVAERVVDGTRELIDVGDLQVCVGASVGWTIVDDAEPFADALSRADRGMYRAKRDGKSRAIHAL